MESDRFRRFRDAMIERTTETMRNKKNAAIFAEVHNFQLYFMDKLIVLHNIYLQSQKNVIE